MRLRAAGIVAVLAVAGTLMVAGAPEASAAAPRCTGVGFRIQVWPDGSNDPAQSVIFPAHSPQVPIWGGYAGAGYWSCSLIQGSTGSGVRRLQQTMNYCHSGSVLDALGGVLLVEDGQFGPKTKRALIQLQRDSRIEDNGEYGPQTARTIRHYFQDSHWGINGCQTLSDTGWPGNSG